MRTDRNRHESHEQYELNDCFETYTFTARKPYNVIRTSKHDSHLDNENYREYDFYDEKQAHRKRHKKTFVRQACNEVFKCKNCRRFIGPPQSGGRHRNHCPFCLFSLHVDGDCSGDRLSACGSRMEPIGSFQRVKGEHVLVHRCLGCGFERFNRIAADDDFELVLALPSLAPRSKYYS